jgi:hypothetical protein
MEKQELPPSWQCTPGEQAKWDDCQGAIYLLPWSNPKKGLSDWVVADDLFVRRIRIQRLPEIDVCLLMTRHAREQQPG